MKSVIILGATGMVGREILHLAEQNPLIGSIIAPTRRPLPLHAKLINPQIDYQTLPDADWWCADVMLSALGTTMHQAGSKAMFQQIDHDYVLAAATKARHAGTRVLVNNSSLGASADAHSFYLRVKGRLEQDLAALDFDSLTHVRPSLLDVNARPQFRLMERLSLHLAHALRALIPLRYRPVSPQRVARAMLRSALNPLAGLTIIESDQLQHSS